VLENYKIHCSDSLNTLANFLKQRPFMFFNRKCKNNWTKVKEEIEGR
jgi:hypothetical protein